MRVFISSTCYDLIDVRAEVAALLTEMGIDPVLSDDKLSDFEVRHDVNAIETCLVNVDSCDEVIVILNQRYGPTLESFGYGPLSATHLEYNRAREAGKPIHFFVRDRTEADYNFWRKQDGNRESLNLAWLGKNKNNWRIFDLLQSHTKLTSELPISNWYTTYSSSVDLKKVIEKRLRQRIAKETLMNSISVNQFPLLTVRVDFIREYSIDFPKYFFFDLVFQNVSRVAAFDLSIELQYEDQKPKLHQEILAPNGDIHLNKAIEPSGSDYSELVRLRYKSHLGVEVQETHNFNVYIQKGTGHVLKGIKLQSRRFLLSESPIIELIEH